MECLLHTKQIGLALYNYASQSDGAFPPAITYGPDGKPWHSWRVLMLPNLNHRDIYDRYRFDEPWNGPHNRELLASVEPPEVFQCPHVSGAAANETSYFAVIGDRTVWPRKGRRTLDEVGQQDGLGITVMLVEVSDSGVPWYEPRDLTFDTMSFEIGSRRPGPRGKNRHPAAVVFVDGRAQQIHSVTTSPEELRSLLIYDDWQPSQNWDR